MVFLKEHLTGTYKWQESSAKTVYTGSPSRRSFDRWNGDQVLFIINAFAERFDSFTIEEGQRIERLITNHLPLNSFSELSVFNWLKLEGTSLA